METASRLAVFLAIFCLILSGVPAVGTANADSHLPDCKANPGCLLELANKWKTLTVTELQTMLDSGADPKATTPSGWTPLNSAAVYGNAEVIPVLVKAGADVNWEPDSAGTPLHQAILLGNIKVIPVLLKAGADVNAKEFTGDTPLHSSAKTGNAEVISMLIKHGAYIQATDPLGRTPLDWAKRLKHWNAVKILESVSGLASPSCFNIIRSKPEQIIRVNGVRMTLLVDTGASITALSHRQARAAGVQPTGQSEFTLADGSVVVNKTGSANISLGGGLTGNFPVSIGDGKGLLGRDVLDEFACQ